MSLFGDEDVPSRAKQSSSLFDDDPKPAGKTGNSLFADEIDNNDSPWAFPTPKKGGRASLVKSLLPASDVPDAYIEAFDAVLDAGHGATSGISIDDAKNLMASSGVSSDVQATILDIVVQSGNEDAGLGRNEFNVLFALIALSQIGEDITLDSVDERKRNLPVPSVSLPQSLKQQPEPAPPAQEPPRPTPQQQPSEQQLPTPSRSRAPMRKQSFGDPEADPWGSPDMHKDHNHSSYAAVPGQTNGANGPSTARTTSQFTTHSTSQSTSNQDNIQPSSLSSEGGWGGYNGVSSQPFATPDLGDGGFGAAPVGGGHNPPPELGRSIGRAGGSGSEEVITITTIAEKEGVFLFQHRNYEVASSRRTTKVELSVWRKQANLSVQEEFAGKTLPPDLEDSLPKTLPELFDTVRSGVRRSSESYINLCNMMERLTRRNEGMAAEYHRFSTALVSLTESSQETYAVDTNDIPLLNEGMNSTARHLDQSKQLLEDEARGWEEGVLEDFKRQRDTLVSMRDMFDRRDKYARDNIPALEKRIANNETKLQNIRNKPADLIKPGEAEKVEDAIVKDKESIVQQHARGVFIKECIRDELLHFQKSQYHISRLHQEWSQERVKYAELQADNWRALSEEVESMPSAD
ncbi:hypothetical protein SNOG_16070 [Parastagonospora nodorum SN15]|uniref:Sorting nexin 8/Mvp1 BAR domain-containing protein n=1 Tax=Phaeosphaeria nodorum (strain SN15 / ATCC MYA-4574 / FGSC 10173) TaxID=321614 RepID=Q0TWZ6_PHANO|nr:hypothetical protein SNOG_16070 [Parastagonospora nodorum SN15]EAT76649.2 hypothetical protein SNOG_16070 [Parastagonospora nodorum SN15]